MIFGQKYKFFIQIKEVDNLIFSEKYLYKVKFSFLKK